MKICFLSLNLFMHGGIQRIIPNIINGMTKEHEITIVMPYSNKDNNNYEKTIRRFQEHENTLYDLVKNICDVNDQNIYTRKVFVHFNRFYLRLANEYGMKSEVKVYYNKLKVVGENGIKQKIYYIMGMLGIKAR